MRRCEIITVLALLTLCSVYVRAEPENIVITKFEPVQQYDQIKHQAQKNTTDFSPSKVCLPYKGIKFQGITLIDPLPYLPKKNECLNQSRLNQLSQDITQAYLNKGYIHNPFQFEDKLSGFLIMRVLEGKVIKLTSKSDRVNLNTIAYHILGNPLKVQDLDQALDQANQMFGSRVTVDVLTQQDGGIHLDFVNEEQRRVNGFIGLDNNASKIYRRWQAKTGAYVDNPFGFSDMLHLGLTHSLKSFQHDYTQSASLLYRIPYGYKALSVYGSISKFKQQLPLKFNVLKQAGKNWQLGAKLNYTLARDSRYISNISIQLEHSDNKHYFEDVLVKIQSPRITSMQAELSYLRLFKQGSFLANLLYERGLPWFNAMRNQGRHQPEGQFSKWRFDLSFNYYYQFFGKTLHQYHGLKTQYSKNYLVSGKQFDLLNKENVRGFNDAGSLSENAVILRNSLGISFQCKNWKVGPYGFVDIGRQKNSINNIAPQSALGYGVGINLENKKALLNVEYARGKFFSTKEATKQENSIYIDIKCFF